MAADSDSDEDETFITLGNALPQIDDDAPKPKPLRPQDIQARDNRGRPRFHGAFSGGFSAGYFNTVGSKEGWTPSTFVSSRDTKPDQQIQRPEDFMDEEDLGEHGIAPRKFVTAGQFSSEERKRRHVDEMKLATSDSVIPGTEALLRLIVPERTSVGVRLLRKMGWKEGQGIGPRLSKKKKKRQKEGQRVYGCALPPSSSEEEGEMDDEEFLKDVTFAPSDTTLIALSAKDNTHGLGYRGLNPQSALPSSHINLFGPAPVRKGGKRGIRGQAFGVGALEDDDEDIYSTDHLSNYDITMGGEEEDNNFGWTAPRGQRTGSQDVPVGYVGKILEGFKLSATQLVQKKDFPPPPLPRSYRPVHVFQKPAELDPSSQAQVTVNTTKARYQDAMTRGVALGETPFLGSVFDLMSKEDKARMDAAKSGNQSSVRHSSIPPEKPEATSRFVSSNTSKISPSSITASSLPGLSGNQSTKSAVNQSSQNTSTQSVDEKRTTSTSLYPGAVGTGFKPFASDPAKQERYEKYLSLVKLGVKDTHSQMTTIAGQTEWDRERELEEFSRAAHLYRPLSGMLAARFTSGKQTDIDSTVDTKVEANIDLSDAAKAAEMKMYGKLTRDVLEWHPDRLVCRRFNIPDPYPQSSIVGLATVKRDKYSVFNFLNFPSEQSQPVAEELLPLPSSSTSDGPTADQDDPKECVKPVEKKSIFSHLYERDSNSANKSSANSISFAIKGSNKPKKYKSIFSHLEDEPAVRPKPGEELSEELAAVSEDSESKSKKTEKNMEVERVKGGLKEVSASKTEEDTSDDNQPPVDLFRAVFRNTDSEDSSSSSSEEEKPESSNQVQQQPSSTSSTSQVVPVTDSNTDYNQVEPESINKVSLAGSHSVESQPEDAVMVGEPSDDEEYGPALPPPVVSTEAAVHIFKLPSKNVLPGNNQHIEGIEARLAPHSHEGASSASKSKSDADYIDLTKDPLNKHKHKHKDRHKHKKDKKEKHKKSKHKKKQRKKEKKKRRSRHSDNSEDSSTDESGTDDTDMPTDREILNRMRSLKSDGRRMKAADFM